MKIWILFCLSLIIAATAHANSFVGNGGSGGDVEFAVTLMQIQETFKTIESKQALGVALCECNQMYKNRELCEPLERLSETQAKFCSATLYKLAAQIHVMTSNRGTLKVRWTNTSIEVIEGHQTRESDAVANRLTNEITVNHDRFMEMKPAERVFLISHELMHFADLDGKPLTDEGAIGPFEGAQGSRQLINSMAAAASVLQGAYPKEIKSYRAKLSRSKSWKPNWFFVDVGSAQLTESDSSVKVMDQKSRVGFGYRFQFEQIGIVFAMRSEASEKKIMDSVQLSEKLNTVGAGVSYRIFPFSDPLTFWGQSFVYLQGLIEQTQAKYQVKEDPVELNDKATVWGTSLTTAYYLPVFWGFWGYLGLAYEYHPYKYKDLDINMNKSAVATYLGVSYAF